MIRPLKHNKPFHPLPLRNPPTGCAYIREHFPHLACANCHGKAPYNVAEKTLKELVTSSAEDVPIDSIDPYNKALVDAIAEISLVNVGK
jgi:hypothetical protein